MTKKIFWKYFFLAIFMLLLSIALGCIMTISSQIAYAVENSTPVYTMTYDLEYVRKKSNKMYSYNESGARVEETKTYTSQTNLEWNNLSYTGADNFNASLHIYGSSGSGSSVLSDGGFITSNKVSVYVSTGQTKATYFDPEPVTLSIYNSSNVLQCSATASSKSFGVDWSKDFTFAKVTATLPDGTYTVKATWYKTSQSNFPSRYFYTITSHFSISTQPPIISLSCGNGGFSNSQVTLNFSGSDAVDSNVTAKYSYSTDKYFPSTPSIGVVSGTPFTTPGNYRVTVTDTAGFTSTATFTIDKTAPTLSLSGVSKGGFTNGNVSASWSTTAVGVNSTARSNTSDALTVKYSYSTDGSFPTSATTAYTAGTTLSDAGNYLMTITDKAGNRSSYTFTIDKTAPTLSLSGVSNGGFTNGDVSASWSIAATSITSQRTNTNDALTVKFAVSTTANFPTKANVNYTSGVKFDSEGNYLMTITDKAGNRSSYTFTIDKTAPTLSLSGVSNGGFTNGDVSASWSTTINGKGAQRINASDTLTVKYSFSTNSSFPTSATTAYTAGTTLSDAGNYLMTITDKAGNVSSFVFTIDKTAPTLSLSGVSNGGFTNGDVSASWSIAATSITSQRTNTNDALTVKCTVSTTADFPTKANTKYTNGVKLVSEGNYLITITDRAGNSSSYTFTIDKTAPTLSLSTSDNSNFINNRTSKNVSASWSTTINGKGAQRINASDTLTVKYSLSTNDTFPTSATTAYTAGAILNTEGKYLITITDKAGNIGSKAFEIYRQAPSFIVLGESGEEFSQSNLAYNKNFKIIFSENCTAKINTKAYSAGTLLIEEGSYQLLLTDELGNKRNATLLLIKTLPTDNFDRLKSPINQWFETTNGLGDVFSFASYDNAYTFADERERATIRSGVWTSSVWDGGVDIAPEDLPFASPEENQAYYVYKSYESGSKLNAYFSIATLNKSIDKYAKSSIAVKFSPNTPAAAAEGEVVYRDTYFSNAAITFNRIANCSLYVDGTLRSYPYTLTEIGTHSIYEVDVAGNSVSYSVVIDAAKPIIRTTNLNGNLPKVLTYDTNEFYTYGLRIYLDDVDELALLKINDDYYLGGTVELRQAGIYSITARDAAGNFGSLTLYISLIEPSIAISENEVNDVVNSFTVAINKNYSLNNINSLAISKFDEDEAKFIMLETDNSSIPQTIDHKTLTYSFNVSGKYRIIIVDAFGRMIEKEYDFIKGSPKGTLSTSGGTLLTSGDSTKYSVYFSWSNLLDCSAEVSLNGSSAVAYAKGTILSKEGTYLFRIFSNIDSVYNLYEVTIDKTAPVGTLLANGKEISNNITTRYAVTLSWTESDATALLNGQPYANGTEISEEGDYTLILQDKAGNARNYTFRIKTTPPKVTVSTSMGTTLSNYDLTKHDVYISWTENNCTCVVNGTNYTRNTKINVEGTYTATITDAYGNSSSRIFTIDKTAPTATLFVDGVAASTNQNVNTNKKVSVNWTESGCTATINKDFAYLSGTVIADTGTYLITLTDAAGNTSDYSFTIKTEKPKAKLWANNTELLSGAATRYDARLNWTEANCTATLDGQPYTKNILVSAEGEHTFTLTDAYGNVSSFVFTIDKTAPTITLSSNGNLVESGGITRFDVILNWDDIAAIGILDNDIEVENGSIIANEGEHTLIVTDAVGNKTTSIFIIDKTAKAGTLIANSSIINSGAISRYSVYFTWNGTSNTATLDGQPYIKTTIISAEGTHTIELTDKAGNVSSFVFTIDKTAPVGVLNYLDDETAYTVESGFIGKHDMFFTWTEVNCSATLNGEPYESGSTISAEGSYSLILIDIAGNSSSYTFTIDKTAPSMKAFTVNNEELLNEAVTRLSVYFDWTERNCTATVNGNPYEKGSLLSSEGNYLMTITDKAGNRSSYTFTIDKTAPVGVLNYLDDETAYTVESGFIGKHDMFFTWTEVNCSATLNGEPYESGSTISAEGSYSLILIDIAGNSSSYTFTIDKTAPSMKAFTVNNEELLNEAVTRLSVYFDWTERNCTATVNGNPYEKGSLLSETDIYIIILADAIGNTTSMSIEVYKEQPNLIIIPQNEFILPYLNDGFSATWSEENCVATVNGEPYTKDTLIEDEGEYIVILRNKVGAETVETIIVDRTAPVISVYNANDEVVEKDFSNKYIYFDWTESGCTAKLNKEDYRSKTYITKDNFYTLILTDAAGNASRYDILLSTSKPQASLYTESGKELNNGSSTKEKVFISISQNYDVTVDGIEYDAEEAPFITEIGKHIVIINDAYGNSSEYQFTIKDASEQAPGDKTTISELFEGSSTGTYILIAAIVAVVVGAVIVPAVFAIRANKSPFRKIKK